MLDTKLSFCPHANASLATASHCVTALPDTMLLISSQRKEKLRKLSSYILS